MCRRSCGDLVLRQRLLRPSVQRESVVWGPRLRVRAQGRLACLSRQRHLPVILQLVLRVCAQGRQAC